MKSSALQISIVGRSHGARGRPQLNEDTFRDSDSPLLKRLRHLLGEDLARVWRWKPCRAHWRSLHAAFNATFQTSGHTFSSVLRATRTAQASRLLRQTGWALADIGYACGYADQAHFQRDFRRAVNMTPKAFRDVSRLQTANPDAH